MKHYWYKDLFVEISKCSFRLSSFFMWFIGVFVFCLGIQAQTTSEPIVTLKSNKASVNFWVASLLEDENLQVDFGDGNLQDFELKKGDTISVFGRITADVPVRIYGKRSSLTYFYCVGNDLTELNVSACENLRSLVVEHNLLRALDITNNTKMSTVSIIDNKIEQVDLTKNPELTKFYAQGNLFEEIDFSKNPKLEAVQLLACRNLRAVDFTHNPKLNYAELEQTAITSIDVSHNPELLLLSVSSTEIGSLDVTKNPKLRELYVTKNNRQKNRLKTLDVSQNPDLFFLFVSGNDLESLDLSHNPKLFTLYASECKLTDLDISHNPDITNLVIWKNYLTFNTLPLPDDKYFMYDWEPQRAIIVDGEYPVNGSLDLSHQSYDPDYDTEFRLVLTDSFNPDKITALTEGIDYSVDKGVLTFLKSQPDSVYCEMKRDVFGGLAIQTEKFLVRNPEDMGKPSLALSMTTDKQLGETFSMQLSAYKADSEIEVDFGDGVLKPFTLSDGELSDGQVGLISGELKGREIKVYTHTGIQLKELRVNDQLLSDIDIRYSHALNVLDVERNNLESIDFSGSLCLKSAFLDHNKLTELNVKTASGLNYLNCSNNQIESIETGPYVYELRCNNNKLSQLDVRSLGYLKLLDVSANLLEEINVTENAELADLNVASNNLTKLDLRYSKNLQKLNVSGNKFLFSTLTVKDLESYIYAPQQKMEIAGRAYTVDLSSERMIGQYSTHYVWKTENGEMLTEGVHYTIEEGVTTFTDTSLGYVFCEMTNEQWPDLVLATTLVQPVGEASELVAKMVVDKEPGTSISLRMAALKDCYVYVDFGDGVRKEFKLETGHKALSGKLGASKTVSIYGYSVEDTPITIFSLSNLPLASIDLTKLTELTTLTLTRSNLSAIDLSANTKLESINIEGQLTELDLSIFPNLKNLTLQRNKLETMDLSRNLNLETVVLNQNVLTSVCVSGLSKLTSLRVADNQLTELDLTDCTALTQLDCSGNQFMSLDLSALSKLNVLTVNNNNLKFSTLPILTSNNYNYAPQNDVIIELVDGKVDLSSEVLINDIHTVYVWKTVSGTTLVEGTDYSISEGITTFLKSQDEEVYCEMTNEQFPKLVLKSLPVKLNGVGICDLTVSDNVFVSDGTLHVSVSEDAVVTVYDLTGRPVSKLTVQAGIDSVFNGLPKGVYLVVIDHSDFQSVRKVVVD